MYEYITSESIKINAVYKVLIYEYQKKIASKPIKINTVNKLLIY